MFSCPIATCHVRQYQSNESEWNNFIEKILRMQCANMAMTISLMHNSYSFNLRCYCFLRSFYFLNTEACGSSPSTFPNSEGL